MMNTSEPKPTLSVVISNWNTCDLLAQCLATLAEEACHLSGLGIETFVVDNASTDGSTQMVRERFPWVCLIENEENVGFARANNQAIRESRGCYVLLLNSDTEVGPGAFKTLVELMEAHPQAGAVGPRMLNPDRSLQNSYGSLPTVLSEVIGPYWLDFVSKPWGWIGRRFLAHRLDGADHIRVERVSFACTLIRREALQQVGLLDERFVFYSEDYDWFKRLKEAGWQVLFCPQAQVVHHWGASSSQQSEWATSQLYRSKRLYYAKHYGRVAEGVLRAGLVVRFVIKLLLALVVYPKQREISLRYIRLNRQVIRDMLRSL